MEIQSRSLDGFLWASKLMAIILNGHQNIYASTSSVHFKNFNLLNNNFENNTTL